MSLRGIRPLLKPASRYGLVWLFLSTAVMHFVRPMPFVRIVPPYFPHALTLVYVTGIAEIIVVIGLLVPAKPRACCRRSYRRARRRVPGEYQHGATSEKFRDIASGPFFWLRLPLQLVYIAWTVWCGDLLRAPRARLKESQR